MIGLLQRARTQSVRSAAASNAYELGHHLDNLYVGVSVNNKKREKKIASTKLKVFFYVHW